MPYRAKKQCAKPACPVLVPAGVRFCDVHEAARQAQLDDRRGSASQRGYGTAWEQRREAWKARFPATCGRRSDGELHADDSLCVQRGLVVPARTLDHIVRKLAGGTDDDSNLQWLCDPCHNVKRQKESRA